MADLKGNKKRLMTINLSLFAPSDPNTNTNTSSPTISKSPKSFKPNGVVGLGIVVAMDKLDHPKSTPIPIFSASSASKMGGGGKFAEPISSSEEMELSEEYTCVTSHIGNNLIKKREYFDGVLANESESTATDWVVAEEEEKAPAVMFRTADFLNSCYLCKKQLHGLDIFMYRGEKAFCSSECRGKQISMDERKEKYSSGATLKPVDYSSVSPCSSPMQFLAGMAAA